MKSIDFKNKKIVVMGLGLHGGGLAITKWLAQRRAKLLVTDLKTEKELKPSMDELKRFKNIRYVLGKHRSEDFKKADLVIQNPGVPRESKFLAIARKNGVAIENEASLFFKLCPAPIIAVTGTRGKSTTTSLIFEIFKKHNPKTLMAGNIRKVVMFEIIDQIKKETPVILELSSWQLETMAPDHLSPHIGVITNLMPDHLNRYKNMADYAEAKKIIFKYQKPSDFIILNKDNPTTREIGCEVKSQRYWFSKKYFKEENGSYVQNNIIYFRRDGIQERITNISGIKLKGEHNLENVLAAVTVAKISGIPTKKIIDVLKRYKGLENRQELIRTLRGVEFYNDTTATTPDAVIAALKTIGDKSRKNIILICGGSDKGLDYKEMVKLIRKKVKFLILLKGKATEKITASFKKDEKDFYKVFNKMKEAVRVAFDQAERGDVVLLSPGAASFGLFVNEFDRGDQFVKAVKGLK